MTLALEAAAFLAARRKPVYGRPSKFKVERRVLPPRPVSELPIRSAQPSAPAAGRISSRGLATPSYAESPSASGGKAVDAEVTIPSLQPKTAWHRWYKTPLWKARRRHQLERAPLCEWCGRLGRVTPATVANHNPPHRGDWTAFSTGPLESLCKACHDSEAQRDGKGGGRRGHDATGRPADPAHPWNRATR